MSEPSQRYQAVSAEINAANADDPRTIVVDGIERPYEVVYSERMLQRLTVMYPEASELLRIAALGQHIRRFDIPRTQFAAGRDGYNAWRRACREHHARLLKDKESQALENVVDVVFLDHYFDEFYGKYSYDDAKIIDIIGKTLRKMSPKGHQAALALDLPERTRKLVLDAVEREAAALDDAAS